MDASELAAWTVVSNVLLNLDEDVGEEVSRYPRDSEYLIPRLGVELDA